MQAIANYCQRLHRLNQLNQLNQLNNAVPVPVR